MYSATSSRTSIKYGIIWVMMSLSVGCGSSGNDADLTRYIFEVKKRPALPIEPLPDFKPLPKFTYPEADARRSPFKPKIIAQSDQFAPNVKRPKQPLEAFPLDALKFVGILEQGPLIWALMKQPDGLISRVKPGDYMGQNYGQIVGIKDKSIQLDELMQLNGKWEKKRIVINLSVPD
jgi:type IV pilus assembly protein PilP